MGKSITLYLDGETYDWIQNHPVYDSSSEATRKALKRDMARHNEETEA